MTDETRIPAILQKLAQISQQKPEFRLMQILISALKTDEPHSELYHLSDDQLEEALENFVE